MLWDRRVIFVANLLGLFFGNEKETGELMDQVGPLETYGGRLVPVLDLLFRGAEDNIVILETFRRFCSSRVHAWCRAGWMPRFPVSKRFARRVFNCSSGMGT